MLFAFRKQTLMIGLLLLLPFFAVRAAQSVAEEQVEAPLYDIHIYRPDEFINRALVPTVFIDGVSKGRLENSECLIIGLTEGEHFVVLAGEFPEWGPQYNKELKIKIDKTRKLYLKLEPIFTGVVTPTEVLTDFEFFEESSRLAEQEIIPLNKGIR